MVRVFVEILMNIRRFLQLSSVLMFLEKIYFLENVLSTNYLLVISMKNYELAGEGILITSIFLFLCSFDIEY